MRIKWEWKESYLRRNCLPAVLALLFIFISIKNNGQGKAADSKKEAILKGNIVDEKQHNSYHLSVVGLLQCDSLLVRFMRSKNDGSFLFDSISPGNYILLITHPFCTDYSRAFSLSQG